MNDNALLLLSTEGVEWRTASSHESMNWKDLDSIQKSDSNILLEGTPQRILIPLNFVGTSPQKLMNTISETQKKVLLGVMK
jgi:hypothetical protein